MAVSRTGRYRFFVGPNKKLKVKTGTFGKDWISMGEPDCTGDIDTAYSSLVLNSAFGNYHCLCLVTE